MKLKDSKRRGKEVLVTCCGSWYWDYFVIRLDFYHNGNKRTGLNAADIMVYLHLRKDQNAYGATKRACREELDRLTKLGPHDCSVYTQRIHNG